MVEDSTQTRCLARVLSAPPPSPSLVVRRRTPRSSSLPRRLFGCRPPSRPRSSCHANGTSDRSLEDATELIVYSCSFVFTAKARLYLQRWVSIHAVYCTIAFETVRLDSNKSRDCLPRAITDCFNHERSNLLSVAPSSGIVAVSSRPCNGHLSCSNGAPVIIGQRRFLTDRQSHFQSRHRLTCRVSMYLHR